MKTKRKYSLVFWVCKINFPQSGQGTSKLYVCFVGFYSEGPRVEIACKRFEVIFDADAICWQHHICWFEVMPELARHAPAWKVQIGIFCWEFCKQLKRARTWFKGFPLDVGERFHLKIVFLSAHRVVCVQQIGEFAENERVLSFTNIFIPNL